MKLTSTNPAKNYEVIGEVEVSIEQGVEDAVSRARRAQPAWAEFSVAERCKKFASFIEVSKKRSEEIAKIIAKETGRPITSARGNVGGGIDYFNEYIKIAEECLAPKVTHETDTQIHRAFFEPWGVIAVISPWNYPFLNVAFQCGQALLAGNTIVYKNSEEDPLFAKILFELFEESDMPKGVFNVVYGDGKVGDMLARSNIDMISFTGSTQTGKMLTKLAAEKFIPILTELGGSSPGIIFEDTDLNNETMELIYGLRFWNGGQSCDALKRLIVQESIFDEMVDKLTKIVANKKVGDSLDDDTDIGPLVAQRQLTKLEGQVKDAVDKGAKIVIGGKRPKDLRGAYYEPTILINVTKDMRVWKEEVFGPVLPIVSFKTDEEAIQLANDTPYGLGAYVMTKDKTRYENVAKKLETSMVAHNSVMYWHPKNPFGGYKQSGMGRTHGEFGFAEVTQVKLVSEEK